MSTIKQRHLYRWAGDHVAYRDASEYVPDVRDIDPFTGKPPAWFLRHDPVEKLADEIELDHVATSEELATLFATQQKG